MFSQESSSADGTVVDGQGDEMRVSCLGWRGRLNLASAFSQRDFSLLG